MNPREHILKTFLKTKGMVSDGLGLFATGLLILLLFPPVLMAQEAAVTEAGQEILTYPFDDPDPVPVLTRKNRTIYPYHVFDGYSETGQKQK